MMMMMMSTPPPPGASFEQLGPEKEGSYMQK